MPRIPEGALPDRCPECGRHPTHMYQDWIAETYAFWCRNNHRWVVPNLVAKLRASIGETF